MTLKTFPDYPLSKGSSLKRKSRVLEKKLGDGYTQSAADGINHIEVIFNARFLTRPTAEINIISAFLIEHGGYTPFLFILPDEDEPRQWRCKEWNGPTWVSASYRSLTATFIENIAP